MLIEKFRQCAFQISSIEQRVEARPATRRVGPLVPMTHQGLERFGAAFPKQLGAQEMTREILFQVDIVHLLYALHDFVQCDRTKYAMLDLCDRKMIGLG